MASLYEWTGKGFELQAKLQDILDDPEATDEQKEEALAEYAAVKEAIEPKLESYFKIMKNREADVTSIDTEIKRLQSRKKSAENDVARIRFQILSAMQACEKEKVKTPIGTFSIKPHKSLVLHLEEEGADKEIPAQFWEEQPPKLDKRGLKAYLIAHPEIVLDSAEIVEEEILSIR